MVNVGIMPDCVRGDGMVRDEILGKCFSIRTIKKWFPSSTNLSKRRRKSDRWII